VVVPVRYIVHLGAVAVALELLEPELLVGTFSRETMDQIVRDELRKYASARWGGRAARIATCPVLLNKS
jgi:hypothetical protein